MQWLSQYRAEIYQSPRGDLQKDVVLPVSGGEGKKEGSLVTALALIALVGVGALFIVTGVSVPIGAACLILAGGVMLALALVPPKLYVGATYFANCEGTERV